MAGSRQAERAGVLHFAALQCDHTFRRRSVSVQSVVRSGCPSKARISYNMNNCNDKAVSLSTTLTGEGFVFERAGPGGLFRIRTSVSRSRAFVATLWLEA